MTTRSALQAPAQSGFQAGLEQAWHQASASLPGGDWMRQIRHDALGRFARDGLPGRRIEAWKYADLATLRPRTLSLAAVANSPKLVPLPDDDAFRVDLVNGRVVRLPAPADLPDGFEVMRLADALDVPSLWLRPLLQVDGNAINNLNLAFATDGVLARVGRNVHVDRPLIVSSACNLAANMSHDRSVIVLEEGAQLTLIEKVQFDGVDGGMATSRLTLQLAPGARLVHIRLVSGSIDIAAIQDTDVTVAQDACYEQVVLSNGTGLLRQQSTVGLNGQAAACHLSCAYAAHAGRHVDVAIELRHAAPHTESRLLAKGIAGRKGRGVVQGRVVVDEPAQRTDSHQMARGLLLEDGAEIFHKPELEIYADDVKCGHGATVAALDPNQMFYLQSRGIPSQEAQGMLLAAFIQDVSDRAPEALRDDLRTWAMRHLPQREE
jgi:Fe-S cluster assembly protein SufD